MDDEQPRVRVTAYDPATGDTGTQELDPNGYVLVVGEGMYLASETGNGTGTITLVVKRRGE